MVEILIQVPFEDTEISVKVSGFGHWENESAATLKGYYQRTVWHCDDIDFLPLGFTPDQCQAIEKYLHDKKEEIMQLLEENV